MYICQSQSPNSSHHHTHAPLLSPLVSIRLFSTSVSQFLPCKLVHLYHFSRFHIYALLYDTCFSLSDLLHSVWQSLDPSMSVQMTQFHSFLWLSNVPLYICTTSSLSIRHNLEELYIPITLILLLTFYYLCFILSIYSFFYLFITASYFWCLLR